MFLRWLGRFRRPAHDPRKLAEAELRQRYIDVHGRPADYARPTTFTEMLSKRLIDLCRCADPLFAELTDKFAVRRFVATRIGEAHLVPLLWSGTDPAGIPFEVLPPCYIIKTNHGCGGHIRVANHDIDRVRVRETIALKLSENYRDIACEYQYAQIPPKIMIESIVDDGVQMGPITYRFYAFDGHVGLIQADTQTNSIYAFFDSSWRAIDLSYRPEVEISLPAVPRQAAAMVQIAARLSEGIAFVRVDLYATDSQIYFSEMTFTPLAGYLQFDDDEWDRRLGAMWHAARRRLGKPLRRRAAEAPR